MRPLDDIDNDKNNRGAMVLFGRGHVPHHKIRRCGPIQGATAKGQSANSLLLTFSSAITGHAWQGIEFNGDGGYLSVVLGNIDHEILAP